MKFYTQQHRYTCGLDLHARSLCVCILDHTAQIMIHKQVPATPDRLVKVKASALTIVDVDSRRVITFGA